MFECHAQTFRNRRKQLSNLYEESKSESRARWQARSRSGSSSSSSSRSRSSSSSSSSRASRASSTSRSICSSSVRSSTWSVDTADRPPGELRGLQIQITRRATYPWGGVETVAKRRLSVLEHKHSVIQACVIQPDRLKRQRELQLELQQMMLFFGLSGLISPIWTWACRTNV